MMDWFNSKHVATEKIRVLFELFSFILLDCVRGGLSVHVYAPTGHRELSQRVTVPYAACIQYIFLKMRI
jgi:hypothetical protein